MVLDDMGRYYGLDRVLLVGAGMMIYSPYLCVPIETDNGPKACLTCNGFGWINKKRFLRWALSKGPIFINMRCICPQCLGLSTCQEKESRLKRRI